jgi:hypothetical protein
VCGALVQIPAPGNLALTMTGNKDLVRKNVPIPLLGPGDPMDGMWGMKTSDPKMRSIKQSIHVPSREVVAMLTL